MKERPLAHIPTDLITTRVPFPLGARCCCCFTKNCTIKESEWAEEAGVGKAVPYLNSCHISVGFSGVTKQLLCTHARTHTHTHNHNHVFSEILHPLLHHPYPLPFYPVHSLRETQGSQCGLSLCCSGCLDPSLC